MQSQQWLVVAEEGAGEKGPRAETAQQWAEQVCAGYRQLQENYSSLRASDGSCPSRPLLLLAEPHSTRFLAALLAALLADWDVALANPHWGTQEWQAVSQLIAPDVVWGINIQLPRHTAAPARAFSQPAILIPTGGSSGDVKFIHHTWTSLMASVDGFCRRFTPNGEAVNTYCVLPLYHVSGLMQILRAWVSGGQVVMASFKQLELKPLKPLEASALNRKTPQNWFISLVPTQLERLIQAGKSPWLAQFCTVFLGGAPPWPALLDLAKHDNIPLCLSYGMTETAAMVTALDPLAFLQGQISSGQALPHAEVQIMNHHQPCGDGEVGQVVVHAASIAYGCADPFVTDDLGYLDAAGHLHITGRVSGKIISGGENIFPAEVEAALRSTGQVRDVCVLGLPDALWGEAVTAAYVPADQHVCATSLQMAIASTLSRYKQPKRWVPLAALPRNAQGKLNRQQLLAQIALASEPDQV
ncbi:MAG: AMP-binding protein [Phormidesmis sp. RL_2_1]|nr:AMP-binding protein [Phormidesmis sp. RL_2_1]